jgi:hypothetical protein
VDPPEIENRKSDIENLPPPRPSSKTLSWCLGTHRSNTTSRWTALVRTAEAVMPAVAALTASRRPDRAAEKALAFCRDVERLRAK